MHFERVLRHYHPLVFLHMWPSSENLFPQTVFNDTGHLADTAHAWWTRTNRSRLLDSALGNKLEFPKREVEGSQFIHD